MPVGRARLGRNQLWLATACNLADQREVLAGVGLNYIEKTFTAQSKANIYAALRDAIVNQHIELLDHSESLRELRLLEASMLPSGGMRIQAPEGAGYHDDYADVLALLSHELRPKVSGGGIIAVGGRDDRLRPDNILNVQF